MTWSPRDGFLRRAGALAPGERQRWVTGVYAARADWTPCFEGVHYTLGRAYYTHLEEDRAPEYFAGARASDAGVDRVLPGMRARVLALLAEVVREPVVQRPGWCGPGVHIFPAGDWLSHHGGDVHFDTEALSDSEREARAPALSAILMLQRPMRGGGLRVWDARYEGEDEVEAPERIPSVVIDYEDGDLVVIDSYRLHQIQPFAGVRDRVSIMAHVVFSDGRWQAWF